MNTCSGAEVCRKCKESWIDIYLDPRNVVDRVEVCVIVAAVFMILLAILAPRRRQSRSIIVRSGVEGMFILSFPLLFYTFGLMGLGGLVIKSELYPIWGTFLAMLYGGTSAMSVYKLDENKQPIKLYCDYLLFMYYMGTVLGILITAGNRRPYIWFVLMALIILLSTKCLEQWFASNLARKPSSENGITWLDRYMKGGHQLSTSCDPLTMRGYKYAVLIHAGSIRAEDRPITLEEIWSSNMGVLSIADSPHIQGLKDLCLSFSLFHLVVRRYFGYSCPESNLDETRDLVYNGLFSPEGDYIRAFRVIEAELAFVYDFFFTKYAFIMYGSEVWCCVVSLTLTFLSIAMGTWSLGLLNTHRSILDDLLVQTSRRDVMVTMIALSALSIFQLIQVWSYCVSDWGKVSFVCKYITHPSWQGNDLIEMLLLLLGRPRIWLRPLRYWSNTIGQYSVIDSFSTSCWDRLKYILPGGQAGKSIIELRMEVKTAVAETIKNSRNGHLTNGASALVTHHMHDGLGWACQIGDEFTLTHSILVWHIATSYCEISGTAGSSPNEDNLRKNKVVATSLSKYCAYLVAFAPKMLPGSPADTEVTLSELVKEVKTTLQDRVSPGGKFEKLTQMHNEATESMPPQLLAKGAKLGKALESMLGHNKRWALLADFWAEMLVYIAPSDNVAGHIELLAEGGEFLTHVWALLMHAGILERPAAAAAAAATTLP